MKFDRNKLRKMIVEEVNRLNEWSGEDFSDEAAQDKNQEYIDFIVAVQEAAREALAEIERGTDPANAAWDSKFKGLVEGFLKEEFYDYFYG